MAILIVANQAFYCASPHTEVTYRDRAKQHMLARHKPGIYTSPKVISRILQDLVAFYESEIDVLLIPLLSRSLVEVLLLQYDNYVEIYRKFISGNMDHSDKDVFRRLLAPTYARTVKFLCERVTLLENIDAGSFSRNLFEQNAEGLFACATSVVQISMDCDSGYYIVPDHSRLEIFPQTDERIYHLGVTETALLSCLNGFGDRWRWEVKNADQFVSGYANPGSTLLREFYPDEHAKFLDQPFSQELGYSYQDAVSVLGGVFDAYLLPSGASPVWFVEKSIVLSNYSGLTEVQVNSLFEAFTISAANIALEGRSFWNPKFQHRLFRRGILQVKENGQDYYCWGESLYQEALMALVKGFTYQYVPVEWNRGSIRTAAVELSRSLGSWFENLSHSEFTRVGIPAVKSKKSIGHDALKLEFTPGEIDLLAYLPAQRMLVIGECKRVEEGTDPKHFRDAKNEFVTSKKPYVAKLRAKVQFVKDHLNEVCKALSSAQELNIQVEPKWISAVLITRYPTIAACFIPDLPCVSLAELIRDYSGQSSWPYPSTYLLSADQVRSLAYQFWEEDQWNHGNDQAHWYRAEAQLAKIT